MRSTVDNHVLWVTLDAEDMDGEASYIAALEAHLETIREPYSEVWIILPQYVTA